MTTLLREVPLPNMPRTAMLWAVCIQTQRNMQIVAKLDEESAVKHAYQVNDWLAAVRKRPDFDAKVAAGLITWTGAEAIEWPYSPEAHAEGLADEKRKREQEDR